MRTIWTTAGEPDPRLLFSFPVTPAEVVAATSAGLVTLTGEPDDDADDEPGLRIWDASSGGSGRHFPDVDGRLLVATGTTAVVCDWSDTPRLVDLVTGAAAPLPGHRDIVQALVLADPETLVSAGWDGLVRLTHLGTRAARELDAGERLNAVAVPTINGRRVVLAAGQSLHAFDFGSGAPLPAPQAPSGRVDKIATWPGSYAVLTADGAVELPGRPPLSLPPRRYALDLLATTGPGGRRLLAVVGSEDVTVWDVESDRAFGPPLLGPTSWPGAAIGPDGSLITVSAIDRRLAVWHPFGSGGPQWSPRGDRSPRGHSSTVECLAVSPDGRIIAGGSDGTVGSWSLGDGTRGQVLGRLAGPVHAVAAVEAGGEVQVLAGGGDLNGARDDELHRWPGAPVHAGHQGEMRTIAPAGPSTVLTGGCDGTVACIDLIAGAHAGAVPGVNVPNGIAVRDGRAAIGRFPHPFQLWDLAAGREIPTPATDAMEAGERVIGWAGPDEIVTSAGETARVRDLRTGFATVLDPLNTEMITAVAASDEAVAIGRADGSLSITDPSSGTVREAAKLPYPATALCWSPGGQLVVACRRDLHLMA